MATITNLILGQFNHGFEGQPVEYGATLCGYALQLAYDELVRICMNEEP